jgi:DUF917 family protein
MQVMHKATSEKMVERAFRAALSEMGSMVGFAKSPYTGKATKEYAVEHTISLSWRIGRAIALCRARSEMDAVANVIVDAVGGPETAKVLFRLSPYILAWLSHLTARRAEARLSRLSASS